MNSPINGLLPIDEPEVPSYVEIIPPPIDPYAVLRDFFEYIPETGEIKRKQCYQSRYIGCDSLIKSQTDDNFQVHLLCNGKRKSFSAWKVATYLVSGIYPTKNYVAHFIDGDKRNHKADNLAVIPRTFATHLNNKVLRNFSIKKNGEKFVVSIKRNTNCHYLGSFNTEKEARVTYMKEKVRIRAEVEEIVKLSKISVILVTKRLYKPCAIQ